MFIFLLTYLAPKLYFALYDQYSFLSKPILDTIEVKVADQLTKIV